ncbi:MAG: BCD family MFS transporter [Gammaproteobacteria bacterium]|nr:BCD family MFS transporter [Gammaproteobacteria bacterium]
MSSTAHKLGWGGIIRLGLVQSALGSIVVLTTSTLNRVMVVEFALPAMLPGILVALHYAVQIARPRLGHGSDVGGRRTPWIIGGMSALALGGFGAALATIWIPTQPTAGVALAVFSFLLIGIGVGASGTTLLVLLAKLVQPERRAAAATTVWLMMIVGFIVTSALAGHFLDPFSPGRLVLVMGTVCGIALLVTALAVHKLEPATQAPTRLPNAAVSAASSDGTTAGVSSFWSALQQVWGESQSRRFAVFVFVSMLAYSAQDLILEPFAGKVFGLSPGQSTQLASVQHSGVLLGMILVGVLGARGQRGTRSDRLRAWSIGGCIASGLMLLTLAGAGLVAGDFPLRLSVFALGLANGAFAVAAIAAMMGMVSNGHQNREGMRMGLWGAAQALAFGLGGFIGTAMVDLMGALVSNPGHAYAVVFALEAMTFALAAYLGLRIDRAGRPQSARPDLAGTGSTGVLAWRSLGPGARS